MLYQLYFIFFFCFQRFPFSSSDHLQYYFCTYRIVNGRQNKNQLNKITKRLKTVDAAANSRTLEIWIGTASKRNWIKKWNTLDVNVCLSILLLVAVCIFHYIVCILCYNHIHTQHTYARKQNTNTHQTTTSSNSNTLKRQLLNVLDEYTRFGVHVCLSACLCASLFIWAREYLSDVCACEAWGMCE